MPTKTATAAETTKSTAAKSAAKSGTESTAERATKSAGTKSATGATRPTAAAPGTAAETTAGWYVKGRSRTPDGGNGETGAGTLTELVQGTESPETPGGKIQKSEGLVKPPIHAQMAL